MTYDIYGIGNALVDIEVETNDSELAELGISKGLMSLVDADRQLELITHFGHSIRDRASGGSAANSIIAAAQLGSKCFYSCLVADDDTGRFFISDLTANGVSCPPSAIHLSDDHTGTCLVMITPDTERTMNTFLGISANISSEQIDISALRSSALVYAEGYLVTSERSKHAVIDAFNLARNHGVKTAFTFSDPSMTLHFKEALNDIISPGVDILFCNDDEAMQFSGLDHIDDAIATLAAFSKVTVVTKGKDGAVIYSDGQHYIIPPFPVDAIDSNGAGDSFSGAFLSSWLSGKSLEDAGRIASFMASRVVSRFGPRLSGHDADAVRSFAM